MRGVYSWLARCYFQVYCLAATVNRAGPTDLTWCCSDNKVESKHVTAFEAIATHAFVGVAGYLKATVRIGSGTYRCLINFKPRRLSGLSRAEPRYWPAFLRWKPNRSVSAQAWQDAFQYFTCIGQSSTQTASTFKQELDPSSLGDLRVGYLRYGQPSIPIPMPLHPDNACYPETYEAIYPSISHHLPTLHT
jgi:hypothetical protein